MFVRRRNVAGSRQKQQNDDEWRMNQEELRIWIKYVVNSSGQQTWSAEKKRWHGKAGTVPLCG